MNKIPGCSIATPIGSAKLLLACIACAVLNFAQAANKSIGTRQSVTVGTANPGPNDRTIPTFTDAFSFNGIEYRYTMVGTNPRTSGATTVVPSEIIPLRLVFADGTVFDGTPRVLPVIASPIFQPAAFISGVTQYGDALQRAQFWNSVAANGGSYHVLLKHPTVRPTVTVPVPAGRGMTGSANGVRYGLIDLNWFAGSVIQRIIGQWQLDPTVLPIFLSDAVYLSFGNGDGCCVVGFHGTKGVGGGPASGKGNQPVNTYVWASWDHSEHFGNGDDLGGKPAGGDIDILSHEIAEWFSDPFNTNIVPGWTSSLAPGFGCSTALEVADPLIVEDFVLNGYHLQDAAFKSWFAHDIPSEGINGQYTYLGTFTQPATLCN